MPVAPCNVIPFVIMRVDVQLAVPGGTFTVSFTCAETMAAFTSASPGVFASTVLQFATPAGSKKVILNPEIGNKQCIRNSSFWSENASRCLAVGRG
jgi:hypothetical protein